MSKLQLLRRLLTLSRVRVLARLHVPADEPDWYRGRPAAAPQRPASRHCPRTPASRRSESRTRSAYELMLGMVFLLSWFARFFSCFLPASRSPGGLTTTQRCVMTYPSRTSCLFDPGWIPRDQVASISDDAHNKLGPYSLSSPNFAHRLFSSNLRLARARGRSAWTGGRFDLASRGPVRVRDRGDPRAGRPAPWSGRLVPGGRRLPDWVGSSPERGGSPARPDGPAVPWGEPSAFPGEPSARRGGSSACP